MKYPTQAELRELFDYDNGYFRRKKITRKNQKLNEIVGSIDSKGYRTIRCLGNRYPAHRLVWIWHYGYISKPEIDHINGIKDDNRIENLRECTQKENQQNQKFKNSNASGYIGVNKYHGKYRAMLRINGKLITSKGFDTPEEAYKEYLLLKKQYHTFNPIQRLCNH